MQPTARPSLSRRAFVAGSAAIAATLALGGCARDEAGSAASGEPEPGATPPDSGVAAALTAVLPYEGGSCNPVGASSALFIAAGWHVYEGLYELDLHTYRPELGLAADIPMQVSELEYEVTLRDNLRFSDGSVLTVEDVCNAFRLNMESDTYGALLSFIQAVVAKDEQTVRFTLSSPMGSLLRERLALVRVFPAHLTPEELETAPVGSGPWRYDAIDLVEGGRITFTPNPYYAGAFPATCERMEWSVILDDEKRTAALTEKRALCIEAAPEVLADQITAAGATIEYVPGFAAPFLMFNCLKAPFDDVRVRQALLYALDVDSLIAQITAGHARACTSLLPDYFRGYHRASTVYSYDKEKARALLTDAGVEELALTLRCNDNWVSELAAALAEDWAAIGVTAEVVPYDTAELFADISTAPEADAVLPFDVVLSPGDPSCFGNDPDLLINWWYGDNVWTRARSCWAASTPFATLTQLVQDARVTTDEAEQQELWNQCFDLIAAEAPLYPLFHRETATAYYEAQLDGYDPISATGLLFLGTTPMKETDTL
ncbi:ABC transporter substrate-binding protein [Adlercreutzia sp. R7]|uniref:ABC transporter substrate-binding protein n=1 Tax=Adlercreutzia wanghongyangiae TaxID=3111451 RepID=A0ABU6IJ60_9ACTN|nr:ABC transporter substrate-binding protein [Adlercreutzia sp. R7]